MPEVVVKVLPRSRRWRMAPLAVAAAVGLTGCPTEPLEIIPRISRSGTYTMDGAGVNLSGDVRCDRATTEPVDLFIKVTSGTQTYSEEGSVPSCPATDTGWRTSVATPGLTGSSANVTIEFCTNPVAPIDEDCTTVSRSVTFSGNA